MASRAKKDVLPTGHPPLATTSPWVLSSLISRVVGLISSPTVHSSEKTGRLLRRPKSIAPILPYLVAASLLLSSWIPLASSAKPNLRNGLLGSLPVFSSNDKGMSEEKGFLAGGPFSNRDADAVAVGLGTGWAAANGAVTAGAAAAAAEGTTAGAEAAAADPESFAAIAPRRTVMLPLGNVQGAPCSKFPSVTGFLGIPYADPVVGARRFSRPTMYSQRYPSPALEATTIPPACGSICGHMGDRVVDKSSENCLFLNMWVPPNAVPGTSKLPVRVYIHGGAVTECSASDANIGGCDFVHKTGIIQVNIQFRLGVFGYLAHPETLKESNTTGNWGLLDQQLALRWVKENIAYFGGDPEKVLLNGNSAGGQRVDFHMVLPGSAGLFSAAIAQSPSCSHFISMDQAYGVSGDFLSRIGCSQPLDPAAELACLRAVPWETLQSLSRSVGEERPREIVMCDQIDWQTYFQHTVDGTVVPYQVTTAYISGNFNQVPYMVGVTTADGRDFIEMFYVSQGINITASSASDLILDAYPGVDPGPILEAYPEASFAGKHLPDKARLTSLWTDIFFTCPVYRRLAAMARQKKSPTYLYLWNAIPSCPQGDVYYGPTHASELMFTSGITTAIYPPDGNCNFSEAEVALSHLVNGAWRGMAEGQAPVWTNGTAWTAWDPRSQLGTFLDLSKSTTVELDFAARCLLHEKAIQDSLATWNESIPVNRD